MKALNLLLSSKGYPVKDKAAALIGMKMKGGTQWPITTLTGSLPLTYTSRAEHALKNYTVYGTSAGAGVACESGEPAGYKIPLTNTDGTHTQTNPLYIGSSKLGAEEYLDYETGKIYKMIDGVLTPTDPPAPLPAIQVYAGENRLTSTVETGEVDVKGRIRPVIYGFHVDPNDSNPDTAVTYLADAIGKTPAAMGSTTFSYGDWSDAFFIPRPCMLKYDGTVDYYLDPTDYTKRADGVTASDISDPTYAGNAMMEWPLIYYKFVPGETDGEGSFYCSDHKIDDTYVCYSNYDADGNVIPHFYTAIYNGIIDGNGKMRSLSGYRLTPTLAIISAYDNTKTYAVGAICKVSSTAYTCITPVTEAEEFDSSKWQEITPANSGGTSGSEEVTAATANNTTATIEWYTDVWADRMLINALLTLMSKSLNGQAKFGRGIDSGSQTAAEAYITGTADDKGLFFGKTGSGDTVVKTFGMENWWACKWHRTAGLIGYTDDYKYKMTYSTVDGSTSAGYSSAGTGYLAEEITRPASQYLVKQRFGKFGVLPLQTGSSGSPSKYWADYYYNGTGCALVGGYSSNGQYRGPWCVNLSNPFSNRSRYASGSLSCKPKKAV